MCVEGHLQSIEEIQIIIVKMQAEYFKDHNVQKLFLSMHFLLNWLQNSDTSFLVPHIVNHSDEKFNLVLKNLKKFIHSVYEIAVKLNNIIVL